MTKTLLSSFTGGAIGTNPSTTTETWASSAGGIATNMTYQPAIAGTSGQSVEVTTARDFVWTTPATRWRLGMWVNRVSGTQTAGLAFILLRSGTTNRGDVFLRNQNGGQIALRAGSGGTTYAGQSTTTVNNGDVWWVELEYNATVLTLQLWKPGNTTATADETFTGSTAAAVDNVRLFNPTGVTGMTMRFGELWSSDGEQIRAGVVAPGTLSFLSNVWADQSTAVVVGKVAGAVEVAVTVGGVSTTVTPDSAGYFRASVTGLASGTSHAYDVTVDGVSRRTGTIRTLPSSGGFTFGWGSCFDTNTSGVFDLMAARNPAFFAMLGDWGYQYITGGANGNTSPTDVATVRTHREPVLAATAPQGFFTGRPISYTYSDCDGAGANADGTTGGHATGAVQAAYRQQFAHPTLPLTNSGARSWTVGRVRFIHTDETAAASVRDSTDDASKTKLGAEQKAWFKGQIDAAKAAGQAVVWCGDGPWIEPTGAPGSSATYNSWAKYNTERTELGTYIAASGVRIVRLHGDTHTLFYDNGTNNPWGGFPTASAAPLHTTGQAYGYTVSGDKYPTTSVSGARQYGVAQVTDDVSGFKLELWGYSSTASAPTEVERFHSVVDLSTPTVVTAAGGLVLAGSASATVAVSHTAAGSLVVSGSVVVGLVVTRSATGGLTVNGAVEASAAVTRNAPGTVVLSGSGVIESGGITRTANGTVLLAGSATATVQVDVDAAGILELTGTGKVANGTPFPESLTLTADIPRLELSATVPQLTLEAAW